MEAGSPFTREAARCSIGSNLKIRTEVTLSNYHAANPSFVWVGFKY